jgi:hypothetical protein
MIAPIFLLLPLRLTLGLFYASVTQEIFWGKMASALHYVIVHHYIILQLVYIKK